jgi:hypothetical protein
MYSYIAVKTYGGVDVKLDAFLTLAIDGMSGKFYAQVTLLAFAFSVLFWQFINSRW